MRCDACNKPFTPATGMEARQRFCSTPCRNKGKYIVERSRYRLCLTFDCDVVFATEVPNKKYCSLACRRRHNNFRRLKDPLPPTNCIICDELFVPRNKLNVYCSATCRYKGQYRTRRPARPPQKCKACEAIIAYPRINQEYCSPRCRNRMKMRRYRQDPEHQERDRLFSKRYYDECREYALTQARRRRQAG